MGAKSGYVWEICFKRSFGWFSTVRINLRKGRATGGEKIGGKAGR